MAVVRRFQGVELHKADWGYSSVIECLPGFEPQHHQKSKSQQTHNRHSKYGAIIGHLIMSLSQLKITNHSDSAEPLEICIIITQ
jgi:hypothetical protein